MPFKSKKQQRYAFATKQPWAKEFANETKKIERGKKKGFDALPEKVEKRLVPLSPHQTAIKVAVKQARAGKMSVSDAQASANWASKQMKRAGVSKRDNKKKARTGVLGAASAGSLGYAGYHGFNAGDNRAIRNNFINSARKNAYIHDSTWDDIINGRTSFDKEKQHLTDASNSLLNDVKHAGKYNSRFKTHGKKALVGLGVGTGLGLGTYMSHRKSKVRKADTEIHGPKMQALALNTEDCVEWPGAMRNGYGVKKMGNTTINAHRWVYEQATGKKIPKGMAVDHKCRNRKCVNPKHLEVTTHSENKKRAWGAKSGNYKDKYYKGEPVAKSAFGVIH